MKNADMPAMPMVVPSDVVYSPQSGLTKREMMAMHMMGGLNANPTVNVNEHDMAALAVIYADALLDELERSTTSQQEKIKWN